MKKVDVIINVYGKPWQTLCTLKSLMSVSGNHINKIYFIKEKQQPHNDNVDFILEKFNNIIYYTPMEYQFIKRTDNNMNSIINRYSFRYQYGIENSNNKYVFITHNDVLYTGDIIGNMLQHIGDNAGIGQIGQCWNCPAFKANKCNGEKFNSYLPTYDEILQLSITPLYSPARGLQFFNMINKSNPMPLPECRLNEFACIIDREITMKECFPNGDTPLFGSYDGIDLDSAWFRSLCLKGFKFKNYDINIDSNHLYYSNLSGYATQLDINKYNDSELFAKKIL